MQIARIKVIVVLIADGGGGILVNLTSHQDDNIVWDELQSTLNKPEGLGVGDEC
jgi:hypothetical protein